MLYKQIPAGLTHSTTLPDMDFETYSEAGYYFNPEANRWQSPPGFPKGKMGLPAIGAPRYAEDPTTEVLSLAYDLKDGRGARLWIPGMAPPVELFNYLMQPGALIEAYNASFEFYIWHYICHLRMGWPPLPLSKLRCAKAKAAAWGLPNSLDDVAKVLQTTEQKDSVGKSLIKKLCCPRNPTKKDDRKRLHLAEEPVLFSKLYDYCIQDIATEGSISATIPDLSPEELSIWQLDQEINVRGVQIDIKGLQDCLFVVKEITKKYTNELRLITGIPDATVDTLKQLQGWMAGRGVTTTSLDKEHVTALLERQDIPPEVRRILEIRQTLGSASVKKLYALARSVNSDGRLRSLYGYCGARQTGRFAGMGAQPQNIPGGGPEVYQCPECAEYHWTGLDKCPHCWGPIPTEAAEWCVEAAQRALLDISSRSIDRIEALWGNAIKAVSGCLRALFVAAPGYDLTCSDYSAIEAVVAAGVSGEEWRLQVFRTHGKIYEMSAAKTSGVPFDEILAYKERTGKHHPLRKTLGKVGELGSQFGGWIQAWKNFGADKYMSDEEIKKAILAWRAESPMIVEAWGGQWRKHPTRWEFTPELYGLEGAAIVAITNPGYGYSYRQIGYVVKEDVLYCKLPSGRYLTYREPRLNPGINPMGNPVLSITFMGWNSDSTKGAIGWHRRETYGSKFFENVVQGLARDIFTYGMLHLNKAGYPIVLHSHDEPVAEVPKGFGSVEEVEKILSTPPPWCKDWPIRAGGGWRGYRYRK